MDGRGDEGDWQTAGGKSGGKRNPRNLRTPTGPGGDSGQAKSSGHGQQKSGQGSQQHGHAQAPRQGGYQQQHGQTQAPRQGGSQQQHGQTQAPRQGGSQQQHGQTQAPRQGGSQQQHGQTQAPRQGGLQQQQGHPQAPRQGGLQQQQGHTQAPRQGGLQQPAHPQAPGQGGSQQHGPRPAWGQAQPEPLMQQRHEVQSVSQQQHASSGGVMLVQQQPRPAWGQQQPQPSTSSTMGDAQLMGSGVRTLVQSGAEASGGQPTPAQPAQGPSMTSLGLCMERVRLADTRNWLPLPEEKDDIKLPVRKDQAKEFSRKIKLFVNHFPVTITLPASIFQYEVKIERQARAKKDDEGKPKSGGGGKNNGSRGGAAGAGPPEKKLPKRILQKILKCVRIMLTNEFEKKMKKPIGICTDFSKILYTTQKLEPISLIHSINMSPNGLAALRIADPDPEEDENGTFTISLQPTVLEIDTQGLAKHVNNLRALNNPQVSLELAAVYNAVIKCMPNYKYMAMGKSLLIDFPPPGTDGHKLGGGLTSWPGISACINPGWKIFLNIELAYSTMRVGDKVLDALKEHFGGQDARNVTEWTVADIKSGSDFLKSCKVRYNTSQTAVRGGTVQRIHDKSAGQATFVKENKNITIADYFRDQYKINVNRNGPLLELGSKNNLVPAELCTIKSGQSVNRKLNDTQTRTMVEIARKYPDALERKILEATKRLNLNQNDLCKKFGMKVDEKMLEMQCRVLEAPVISYYKTANGKEQFDVKLEKGAWQVWQHNFVFKKPALEENTREWGILVLGRQDPAATGTFVQTLVRFGEKCGLRFSNSPQTKSQYLDEGEGDPHAHEKNIKTLIQIFKAFSNKCSLVVVVIPFKPSKLYGQVKQAAELSCNGVGIVTQCILRNNFCPKQSAKLPATIQQLLLKINSKLDGICHTVTMPPSLKGRYDRIDLPNLKEAVLVLGADVTHPTPGSQVKDPNNPKAMVPIPSFASVTGSLDRTCMPYMMHAQAQQKAGSGAAEVIQNLGEIVANMIQEFLQRTNALPAKLIYYRDGVGDGQFKEVLHIEMRGIRKACSRFDKLNQVPYEPKITFIVVSKRHKTRFFMLNGNRIDNAPPGTVVDEQIVHQSEMDFYLLSHQAIQGTSRPTRYHVLWDDNDFTQDELQIMTYNLCCMYVRCNRSVKIPAPTYYAHWAAARAKALAEGNEHLYGENLDRLNQKIQRQDNFKIKYPMHFI